MDELIKNLHDVIIIGSGPAGLTAGIYTSRANLKTLLIEGENFGGQLMTTTTVENYSGFNEINGDELISNMKKQAENNGCIFVSSNAIKINKTENNFQVIDSLGNNYKTKSIILAMGASPKKLNFTNSDKFWNKGISSCAVCDGALPYYRNKKIVVIGGGDTAMEEALYLSKFGSEITILVRSNKLRASNPMIKKVMNNKKINIKYNLEVIDAKPNDNNFLGKIIVKNNIDNSTNEIECSGLFYGIGHEPNTQLINDLVELKPNGYIKKINDTTSTSVKGIFASGDVVDDRYRQAITASGSGCMSALDCIRYLEELL